MDEPPQMPGTWDFFQDASEIMKKAGQPFILIAGQDGSKCCWRTDAVTTPEQLAWFRDHCRRYIAYMEWRLDGSQGDPPE